MEGNIVQATIEINTRGGQFDSIPSKDSDVSRELLNAPALAFLGVRS